MFHPILAMKLELTMIPNTDLATLLVDYTCMPHATCQGNLPRADLRYWGCWSLQRTNKLYPQYGILSQIGYLKYPIGHKISNCGLGKYESGNTESENKPPIPTWLIMTNWGFEIHNWGYYTELGIFFCYSSNTLDYVA